MIKPITVSFTFVVYCDGIKYIASATKSLNGKDWSILVQHSASGNPPTEEVYRKVANEVENVANQYDPVELKTKVEATESLFDTIRDCTEIVTEEPDEIDIDTQTLKEQDRAAHDLNRRRDNE